LLAGILAKATAVYEFNNKLWIQVIDPPNENKISHRDRQRA
jgi:hypothetical protein